MKCSIGTIGSIDVYFNFCTKYKQYCSCSFQNNEFFLTRKYFRMGPLPKKDEDVSPYLTADRSSALQESKQFHETPLRARKCSETCCKIIYLANQGEQFTTTEATDFFFAMTKLFQNNDVTLRRMCYLTIKELSKMTEHAFIMTQSLSKV